MPGNAPRVLDAGVAVYCGAPRTGKTTRALQDARAVGASLGWPVLILDLAGAVKRPPGFRRVESARAALVAVLGDRENASWCPRDLEEATALLRAVHAAGRARLVLLVDEWSFLLQASSSGRHPLVQLIRTWRHADVRVLATTQHLSGDLPPAVWSCSPAWHVFRTTGPHSLQAAGRLGLDPEQVRQLPDFLCLQA